MYLRSLEILRNDKTDSKTYPFSIPALKYLNSLTFRTNVTFLVGENVSGKSTLLEAIAYQSGFHTAGGGKNNYYDVDASHSILGEHIRLSWMPKITNGFFLRAETFYLHPINDTYSKRNASFEVKMAKIQRMSLFTQVIIATFSSFPSTRNNNRNRNRAMARFLPWLYCHLPM